MKLKLTKEQEEFINSNSNKLMVDGDTYFYMPYWLKVIGDGKYELIEFEKLPQDLIDIINEARNGNARIEGITLK